MKERLLRQELILDAEDRGALTDELSALALPFTINGHVVVPYQKSAQEIVASLRTKLTVLKIHEPSLEDAYVEFLNKHGREPKEACERTAELQRRQKHSFAVTSRDKT
jgi:ABC-2 type transport system ATP-binding protein